eukprot:1157437-Pelagomonas_calceolata.AAC.12
MLMHGSAGKTNTMNIIVEGVSLRHSIAKAWSKRGASSQAEQLPIGPALNYSIAASILKRSLSAATSCDCRIVAMRQPEVLSK